MSVAVSLWLSDAVVLGVGPVLPVDVSDGVTVADLVTEADWDAVCEGVGEHAAFTAEI